MPNGRIALFNGQTNRDMRVLTQTLPALAKGSLLFRLAIPETFSSVFRWAFMSTLPEAHGAGNPAGRFRCKSCDVGAD